MKNITKTKNSSSSGGCQFYINIRYHQNSSWQGSIQRLDTGETINFRSALELMTLMEAVIAQQSSDQHDGRKFRKWESIREVKNAKSKTEIRR